MASPFSVFRRNQKMLLAIVGITAMVAFVFLDPLMRYVGRGQRVDNPVVVETRYGNLTQRELDNMRASRELLAMFLNRLADATVKAQIEKGLRDPRTYEMDVEQLYGFFRQQVMETGRSGETSEKAAVETLVLSKKAQQLGLVITDQVINDLLRQITGQALTSADVMAIATGLRGRELRIGQIFEALRTELLASNFAQLFFQSLSDVPPAQRFEYYSRLNRRAKAEVIPLAVADFIAQVPDPSASELEKFFDEHKNQFPDPTSPDPGFKVPKRAAFQYFKADFAKFTDQFKSEVTDQEIETYYNENKAQFRAIELPSDSSEEAKKDASNEAGEAKPEASSNDNPEQPKQDDSAASSDAKADEVKPADQPPADSKPSEKKPQDEAAPQQSWLRRAGSPFALLKGQKGSIRLMALSADDEPPAEQPTEAAEAKPAEDAQQKAADKPEEKPDTTTSQAAESSAVEESAADGDDKSAEKAEEVKYEPLDKMRDKIRDSLAADKARKHLSEIFDDLMGQMRRYSDERDVVSSAKQPNAAPVKPFPFAELAKTKGIEARELPLSTAAEVAKEEIGGVSQAARDRRSQFGFRLVPFVESAFADNYPTYQPQSGQDNDGNWYLYWKTEETPAYVPKLDEVREQVVRAWKMIKARDLATKRADEYAAQARAAQKPLAEFFGSQTNLKVVTTDWFSWLSLGNVPFDLSAGQPRISSVEGLDNVGESFMETAFKLPAGGIGVAMNQPEDTAYVIRLAEYERTADELREEFASDRQLRYLVVGQPEMRRMYLAWLDDLNRDAGVHWLREADSRRSGPVSSGPVDLPESDL